MMRLERVLRLFFAFAFSLVVEKYVRIPFATALRPPLSLVFGPYLDALGFRFNTDLIIAGCVMPFVPGIAEI